jgi:HEAT repeat protein
VAPVKILLQRPPTVDETYFMERLGSVNLSERYSAAKALRYRGYRPAKPLLESRLTDTGEDIYVQLEAAAALAAYDDHRGWEFLESKLRSPIMTVPLETQLETVIVASEIRKERSENLLIEVLHDNSRNEELRAGAAWALGEFASIRSASALVDTFDVSALEIKIEAARALLRIAVPLSPHLVELLKSSDSTKRDGISWALARSGKFDPGDVLQGADDNLRRWITYIIGYGKDHFAQAHVEAICDKDPEVYFAASVLWQIVASWVNNIREY